MLLASLALVAFHNYAATPQGAAISAVHRGLKKPPVVLRVNRVGSYATVLTSGGMMESAAVTFPILVEHFSFGWQALDALNFRCGLDSHALGARVETMLMRDMPRPRDERPCREGKDAGPPAAIEAVRRLMRGPLVPSVVVAGDWAMGTWYGGGGGESLYRRRDGAWKLVAYGGGAMGVVEMRQHGVPPSDWCALRIYNAACR